MDTWIWSVIAENSSPVPLFPPRIPHGLAWDGTRISTVRGRRLTAWVLALPLWILNPGTIVYIYRVLHDLWTLLQELISQVFVIKKSSNKHVSDFGRLRSYEHFLIPVHALVWTASYGTSWLAHRRSHQNVNWSCNEQLARFTTERQSVLRPAVAFSKTKFKDT
jgi:hypothetical protein